MSIPVTLEDSVSADGASAVPKTLAILELTAERDTSVFSAESLELPSREEAVEVHHRECAASVNRFYGQSPTENGCRLDFSRRHPCESKCYL